MFILLYLICAGCAGISSYILNTGFIETQALFVACVALSIVTGTEKKD